MDVLLSAQVTEALKQEKRSKAKWQAKYLSAEDQALQAAEDEAAYAAAEAAKVAEKARPGVHNERDAGLLRLAMFDDEENLGNSRPSSSRSRPMTAGAARSQREQIRRAGVWLVAAVRRPSVVPRVPANNQTLSRGHPSVLARSRGGRRCLPNALASDHGRPLVPQPRQGHRAVAVAVGEPELRRQ